MKCSTCGKPLLSEEGFTKFSCPACGKEIIVRCQSCRVRKIPYACKCGFRGP